MTICSNSREIRTTNIQWTKIFSRVTSSGKTLPNQGHDMSIVHHLGKSSQDSRNLSKCQIARGRSPSESTGALGLNSSDKSGTIKHLLVTWQHNNRGTSLHLKSEDIVEKNTAHNQRPARLTHLGKNKGFPANQKGSGKNEGWNEKNLYTRQVENLKRRLGQKWVSRWTENPKGRSRQKLGIKA